MATYHPSLLLSFLSLLFLLLTTHTLTDPLSPPLATDPNITFIAASTTHSSSPNITQPQPPSQPLTPKPFPSSPLSQPPPPPQPPLPQVHSQNQIENIIDALIGSGDFSDWANVFSAADPSNFPFSATFFIPADDSSSSTVSAISVNPFIFAYHTVPQRLSFAELCQLKPFSRLPTLLPAKTILITNNSVSNFTLDGSHLSHPDLYTTAIVAVHGISKRLDYSAYGDTGITPLQPQPLLPPPPSPVTMIVPAGEEIVGQHKGDASHLPAKVLAVSLVTWAAFVLKIQYWS
ncbi:hypothetical protein K2173_000522 [Erythroxylum novogranatense]|uniref:FAS1 domain-containing protein n=1 Tax=Erythroxylum novogranatense TaxID=1862640 RepID=A0AAV8SWH4_9ROSI|nr:hypothetical protein K2173_000522 [Erythroxylum novogranatense]